MKEEMMGAQTTKFSGRVSIDRVDHWINNQMGGRNVEQGGGTAHAAMSADDFRIQARAFWRVPRLGDSL